MTARSHWSATRIAEEAIMATTKADDADSNGGDVPGYAVNEKRQGPSKTRNNDKYQNSE